MKLLVTQLCLTLCDPMDCSLQGCSVHGISQARILEWVAILSSRGSSLPKGRIQVSFITGRSFIIQATGEAQGPPKALKVSCKSKELSLKFDI